MHVCAFTNYFFFLSREIRRKWKCLMFWRFRIFRVRKLRKRRWNEKLNYFLFKKESTSMCWANEFRLPFSKVWSKVCSFRFRISKSFHLWSRPERPNYKMWNVYSAHSIEFFSHWANWKWAYARDIITQNTNIKFSPFFHCENILMHILNFWSVIHTNYLKSKNSWKIDIFDDLYVQSMSGRWYLSLMKMQNTQVNRVPNMLASSARCEWKNVIYLKNDRIASIPGTHTNTQPISIFLGNKFTGKMIIINNLPNERHK